MADNAAWGEDMLDLDKDDREPVAYINWQQRGSFKCDHCERVLTTLGGLKSHVEMVHGVPAVALRNKLKADQKAHAAAEKAKREAERLAAEARSRRKVILSTDEVDEIIGTIHSLIDMMYAYWSQGNCDKDARELIDRLEAKAAGV